MEKNYAQIDYNPDDPDDVTVTVSEVSDSETDKDECILEEAERESEAIRAEEDAGIQNDERDKEEAVTAEENLEIPDTDSSDSRQCGTAPEERDSSMQADDEIKRLLAEYNEGLEQANLTMRRLEKKFADEILNAESRDNTLKIMYKELNDYKAGLIEKALKNVLYDIADIREMMLSQIRYMRDKKGKESISLDEFESCADDLGDILEKYDVTIYKGKPGEENIAVRQKIVKKVETEDDNLVKKVAESLSCGYEYNAKVLYPERISIYVKKK